MSAWGDASRHGEIRGDPVTATGRIIICCYCRKRVYRQKDGTWYHRGNGSTSCRPGEGSARRATPLEIKVTR